MVRRRPRRGRCEVRGPDGTEETLDANAVISAVGQLNRPTLPDIAGRDSFEGPAFHSARWDHDVDLARQAGRASSAPARARCSSSPRSRRVVGELLVFQRTPAWMGPTPDYHDAVSDGLQVALRARAVVQRVEPLLDLLADGRRRSAERHASIPSGTANGESVSVVNDFVRLVLAEYLKAEFADRPDLLEKVTPHYPPGAKRMLRDNGIWARTLEARQRAARHRRHPRDHARRAS